MAKSDMNKLLNRAYVFASRSLYFPPLVVLAAIVIITIWPWQNAQQTKRNNFNQSVQEKTDSVEANLKERFGVYHTSLQSGAGLFQANPSLTNNQWQAFYKYKQENTNRAGIQGTGFSKVFSAEQYSAVQNFMVSQGIENFTLRPNVLDPHLNTAILYLFSTSGNNASAIGYNMLSEPTRRTALIRALESGKAALTQKVILVQDVETLDNQGFLLYVPVYRNGSVNTTKEQRYQNIEGFVYGGFRANVLFGQILENESKQDHYSVRIYDSNISKENLLYATPNDSAIRAQKNTYQVVKPITQYGVTWQFEFTFNSARVLSRSEQNAPTFILMVGIITAFLVFLALLSIFKSRARELLQQKDKEVNLAKDELLSLASHQMRTPATGVKQYLGMVLQGFAGDVSDSQQELLDKAYTSNERQLHVINQILHLAKLETGRIVLAKYDTDLNELINDVVDEHRDELKSRGHLLKLKLPKRPIVLAVDSHMIRMSVENLLSNAIKYTTRAGVITLTLSQQKDSVYIAVKDTGIGIDPKDTTKIFQQFTRVHDERTEKISGTGVGLYLADQLIKLHKGTLSLQSQPGQGSEFKIRLPKSRRKKQ